MPGFADGFFASSPDDPRFSANMALFASMMRGDLPGGLMAHARATQEGRAQALREQTARADLESRQIELASAKRKLQADEDFDNAIRGSVRTPEQAAAASVGPTQDGGTLQIEPGVDQQALLQRLWAVNPRMALDMQSKLEKQDELIKMSAGDSIYNRKQGKFVATAPTAPKEHAPTELEKLITARDRLPQGHPMRRLFDNAINKVSTHQPASQVNVSTGQRGIENELKVRDDFRSEPVYKAYQEMRSAHSQISQSLKQGTPISDTAAATKIMKLLDPGSVVRESELGIAMAASGLVDRIRNYAKGVVDGTKLTPQQRKDFQLLADALFEQSTTQYNAKRKEYSDFSSQWGLNGERITGPSAVMPPREAGAPDIDALLRKYGQ